MTTKTKELTRIDIPIVDMIGPPSELIPVEKLNWHILPKKGMPTKGTPTFPSFKSKPRTPPKAQIKELLSDAADYFEKDGSWCQNALGNDAQVCLVGGLLRMETGDANENYQPTQSFRHPLTTAAVEKLSKALSKQNVKMPRSRDPEADPYFDHVSDWNDAGNRTKTEVVQLLRDASKLDE